MNFNSVLMWLIPLAMVSFFSVSDTYKIHSDVDTSCVIQPAVKKNNDVLNTKLNMTVFYESLCSSCVDFFKEQFSENWLPFYDYLNIFLVPYGKASQTRDEKGNWNFICQHGEDECFYNRIQVCAISRMIKERRKKLFKFISCYMPLGDKDKSGCKCARLINFEFSKLETCAKSEEGFDLLASFGDITHNFRPKLKWVPTIVFDNKFNQTESELASSDLKSLLCQKLNNQPKACT